MMKRPAVCLMLSGPLLALAQAAAPADSKNEGEKLFMEMHRVLTHPRCLNCHPAGDSPKQGDSARFHVPPMTRGGPKDSGPPGMHCAACHRTGNYAASGVPGAPNWHLAPLSMAWENKTPGEICRQILDRRRNGNKSLTEVVQHLTEDELVAWGWNPGTDVTRKAREPVPIAKPEFNRIVHAWAKAGAVCPQ
ncbi:MAG: Isoquinoline 1-oxidoreductase subunit [Burkholderiales bacterium]